MIKVARIHCQLTYVRCRRRPFLLKIDSLKIDSLIGSSLSSTCNIVCDLILDRNLTQHIAQSTHIEGNIPDLVLTTPSVNNGHISFTSDHLPNFSDHLIIFYIPCCPPSTTTLKPLYVFDFSKANFTDLC